MNSELTPSWNLFSELDFRKLSSNQFQLRSDWIDIIAECEPRDVERVAQIFVVRETNSAPTNLVTEWLMTSLMPHPIAYQQPRKTLGKNSDVPFNCAADSKHSSEQLNNDAGLLQLDLELAASGSVIDPLTWIDLMRRHRYRCRSKNSHANRLAKVIEALASHPAEARTIIKLMLQQNFHVTERCTDALQAGLNLAGQHGQPLRSFIEAEKGHDVLIGSCLDKLGSAGQTPVLPATKAMMNHLQDVAASSYLGLAVLVDYFEASHGAEPSTFEQAIFGLGLEAECAGYLKHRRINAHGSHDEISYSLIEEVGGFSVEEAVYARDALTKLVFLEIAQTEQILRFIDANALDVMDSVKHAKYPTTMIRSQT